MKVLVTGATGFLGARLCEKLKHEGYEVYGLGRNQLKGGELSAKGIYFINADLRDKTKIQEATQNIDSIVHSAALSSPWGDYKDFYSVNVEGTRNLIDGALKNRVTRFIHISTPSIYFNFKDKLDIKENSDLPEKAPCSYTKTKMLAEKEILASAEKGLNSIILRPRGLFGPGDTAIIPRLIKAHESGRLKILGSGENLADLTYIDNAVYAVILSLRAPESCFGEIYNISNDEPVLLWDYIRLILRELERELPNRKIPYRLAYLYAFLSEITCKYFLANREPVLTRYTVGLLSKSITLNIDKAKKELGYKPQICMKDAAARYIKWWKEGYEG